MQRRISFECDGHRYDLNLQTSGSGYHLEVHRDGESQSPIEFDGGKSGNHLWVKLGGEVRAYASASARDGVWIGWAARAFHARPARAKADHAEEYAGDVVRAPMTGRLLAIHAKHGDAVAQGQLLAVMEAMKMEYRLESPGSGILSILTGKTGDQVDVGTPLFQVEAAGE